jgi:hypothetical protein
MSSLTAFESCLSMPQPAGAGRPTVSCAWTRTACLSGRLSVSRGQSALPYLLLLSRPRHTSSLSSSHALSSTLRRKTLSRLLSASPISTQKGLSCPRYTRYPASQPIPITFGPIQFPPTNPEAPAGHALACGRCGVTSVDSALKMRVHAGKDAQTDRGCQWRTPDGAIHGF